MKVCDSLDSFRIQIWIRFYYNFHSVISCQQIRALAIVKSQGSLAIFIQHEDAKTEPLWLGANQPDFILTLFGRCRHCESGENCTIHDGRTVLKAKQTRWAEMYRRRN